MGIASLKLVLQGGPSAGQSFVVNGERSIGRGVDNDIIIADTTLSRQHARITVTNNGYAIEDLNSRNGTYVNDKPVQGQMPLRPGDVLRLGENTRLHVQDADPQFTARSMGPTVPTDPVRAEPAVASPPPVPTPARPAPTYENLWLGLAIIGLFLVMGIAVMLFLVFFYASTGDPTPTVAEQAISPTPTASSVDPTVVIQSELGLPIATATPVVIPGIPAAAAQNQPKPAIAANEIDPFCRTQVDIVPDEPVIISWKQPLSSDSSQVWLSSTAYEITLDGRPVTILNYQQDADGLTWWSDLGMLSGGTHYVNIQWYASREISSGLDLSPADGQLDTYGPGSAGEGFCELVVPVAAVTPEPATTPTRTPAPTAPLVTIPTRPAATATSPPAAGMFEGFETASPWQRGDEPNGTFDRTTEQAFSGASSGRLFYQFPTGGNDYVVFRRLIPLGGQPNVIAAKVYGDGLAHFLNVWIRDAQGQVWQMALGQIAHTGWSDLSGVLDPNRPWPSGHVSGPDNGVIDYPITFEAIVLDDGPFDNYQGQGVIYIDDLESRTGTVVTPTPVTSAPPASSPTPAPTTGAVVSSNYQLTVGEHLYEPWGASNYDDLCEARERGRNGFNDRVPMTALNIELNLINNATIPVADDWLPRFVTAAGSAVQVCPYSYDDNGPPPGEARSMTFFTLVNVGDYVRFVQLDVNGEFIQICLNESGAQTGC